MATGRLTGFNLWRKDPARRLREWHLKKQLEKGPRIVAIGGGTGLPVVLRGLKHHTANLTAVVTVADDGGSSGRLRGELGILPPGDIRNCLVALADTEPLVERLFQYRFDRGTGLAGHTFGNLFIAAMTEVTGDFEAAIMESSRVLKVRGTVLPSTLANVTLEADLSDGRTVHGEATIASESRGTSVRRVRLTPADPRALPAAVQAIEAADAVVLGPGSLFTSIVPNLLVPGVRRAVARVSARGTPVILALNVMTQPGETEGFDAERHVAVIRDLTGNAVKWVLMNTDRIPNHLVSKYEGDGAAVVHARTGELEQSGIRVLRARLLDPDLLSREGLVRHHPERLAQAVLSILERV